MTARRRRLVFGALLLAVAGLIGLTPLAGAQSARTIDMKPLADSGAFSKSGTAVLSDLGNGRTRVDVTISPATGDHPAHIHSGECGPKLGGVVYPLNNVRGGKSTTDVNASLSDLMSGLFAVNVHRGATEINQPYVSCGNITPGGPLAFLGLDGPAGIAAVALVVGAALFGIAYLRSRGRTE